MSVKTRAAVAFGLNEPMQIVELDLADPAPGQVMLRMLASGLCHSDLHAMDGKLAQRFPFVPGHEGVGEIIALGQGVTDFAIGEHVIPYLIPECGKCTFCTSGRTNLCVEYRARRNSARSPFSLDGETIAAFMELGTFAEKTVVWADCLVRIPKNAPADHTCCIACGVTTGLGSALIRAKVSPGSSVAVFGAGGVGLSTIEGARLAGAARIIAIDTNPAKEVIARQSGATDFIDPRDIHNIVQHIMEMTGLGVDYAFDCVGHPALARQTLEMTNAAWGVAMCVGVVAEGVEVSVLPTNLYAGRTWTGSLMGGAKRADVRRFVDMYLAGDYSLDHVVSHRLTLDEINRAIEMMKTGESVRSVIVYEG
ncbi:alcohol dehydrogenase catalytic domain-containing protein [Sphingobium sp.]|uniref:alcohol dehydrogenase catalytic domain-containing protein n=1 Tax=Sphingobium sp. TaxID=1912891 RepID=UPI002C482969|nr:alcohol dehydrogenase catalytic domain-containing protein [Sphingobium sp.]HUD90643.1 alcohol dehydrogenase catalytic domain-containing protein [Sphingobium sp.]